MTSTLPLNVQRVERVSIKPHRSVLHLNRYTAIVIIYYVHRNENIIADMVNVYFVIDTHITGRLLILFNSIETRFCHLQSVNAYGRGRYNLYDREIQFNFKIDFCFILL